MRLRSHLESFHATPGSRCIDACGLCWPRPPIAPRTTSRAHASTRCASTTPNPGKLDALNARFRDHTCKLFEKHGMTNVGYWVPVATTRTNKLVYFLSLPEQGGREKSWKEFLADPDWKKAAGRIREGRQARRQGRDEVPDRRPTIRRRSRSQAKGDRVFELRTYTADEGQPRRPQRPLPRPHDQAVREARHDERRLLDAAARARRAPTTRSSTCWPTRARTRRRSRSTPSARTRTGSRPARRPRRRPAAR